MSDPRQEAIEAVTFVIELAQFGQEAAKQLAPAIVDALLAAGWRPPTEPGRYEWSNRTKGRVRIKETVQKLSGPITIDHDFPDRDTAQRWLDRRAEADRG